MQAVYKYCNSPLKNTQKSESNSLESWDPSLFVRMEDHVVEGVGQSLKLSSEFYSASFCVFQFSSDPQSCLTLCNPWTAECQASLSISNSWSLLKFMPIESVMPSSHLILCHPLLLPPSIFPSTGVFSNESVISIRCTKVLEFQL